ncbi:hypothetical protein [Lacinutrix sp.]|uniref:hypothetical protein n=1 Tax=Lacinutrix sp. TaxID=1937692 RepID=UPI0025C24255|nr:hypothetical protein [Lacinutrix sp.]
MNEKRFLNAKFEWQTGFGALTVSQSQLVKITNYIKNKKEHHKTKTFKEEYIDFLKAYNIDYKTEYLFND